VAAYSNSPVTLVWALSGTLAGLLAAGLNLLRVGRPHDRALAWMSFAGCLGWLTVDLAFGKAFGNVFDPRVLTRAINTVVLAAMSLRTVAQADESVRE
jgi:uncharacterized membrane protein YjjB (DUF3815 family)